MPVAVYSAGHGVTGHAVCEGGIVAFARVHGNLDGQVTAFFVMVVAAAEVVVGLAILMAIYRARRAASVDDASLPKY